MVNNYDWMKNFRQFLDFIRDVGKHITVNHMTCQGLGEETPAANRARVGRSPNSLISCVRATTSCTPTTRRTAVCSLAALTSGATSPPVPNLYAAPWAARLRPSHVRSSPRPTVANSARPSGNGWLDARYTSPYKFYQFWLNVSDADAEKYIKIFTSPTREEIEELVAAQSADPGQRAPCRSVLPKKSPPWYTRLRNMRQPLKLLRFFFSKHAPRLSTVSTRKLCCRCSKACPHLKRPLADIEAGISLADLLVDRAKVFPSKGELRKMVQGGGVQINKEKIADAYAPASSELLLNGKYILVQKARKTTTSYRQIIGTIYSISAGNTGLPPLHRW